MENHIGNQMENLIGKSDWKSDWKSNWKSDGKSNKKSDEKSDRKSDHTGCSFLLVPLKMFKYGTGPTPPVSNWTPPNTECDQVC